MKETDIAWAAGFFDGEGCTFVNKQKGVRHQPELGRVGRPVYRVISPVIQVTQVDPQPLERFALIVGGRKPGGPYNQRNPKAAAYYRWDACGRPSVHRVLCLLWPYLSEPKRDQAREVWAELANLKGPKSPELPPLPEED